MQLNKLTFAIVDRNGLSHQKSVEVIDASLWENANRLQFAMHNTDDFVVLPLPEGGANFVINAGGQESVGLLPVKIGDKDGYINVGRAVELEGGEGDTVQIGYPPGRTGVVTITLARATPLEPDAKEEAAPPAETEATNAEDTGVLDSKVNTEAGSDDAGADLTKAQE